MTKLHRHLRGKRSLAAVQPRAILRYAGGNAANLASISTGIRSTNVARLLA